MKAELLEDIDEARELHRLSFPDDHWVGNDHTFWKVTDSDGRLLGFCSAIHNKRAGEVFLSRSAVVAAASGRGVQRFMIRVRARWAIEQGARRIVTYVHIDNHPSLVNLIKAGMKLYKPRKNVWYCNPRGMRFLYFKQEL